MNKTISLPGELQEQRQRAESKQQNTKQMPNPRLQQMKATTYKARSTANIPTTNILVKSNRSSKHEILGKKRNNSISMVDDHKYRSDEVGKIDEWCETFRFNMTMSMNMIRIRDQNNISPSRTVTIETTFPEQAPKHQTDDKTKIATGDRSHLQTGFHY